MSLHAHLRPGQSRYYVGLCDDCFIDSFCYTVTYHIQTLANTQYVSNIVKNETICTCVVYKTNYLQPVRNQLGKLCLSRHMLSQVVLVPIGVMNKLLSSYYSLLCRIRGFGVNY